MVTLLLYITALEPFHSFALRFDDIDLDLRTRLPSEKVVFVAVDEASVNRFGRWPWSRAVLAEGISKIDSSTVLLLDMVFSEPTEQDHLLAKSIAEHGNTLCGFFLRHQALVPLSERQRDVIEETSLERLLTEDGHRPLFVKAAAAEVDVEPILSACSMLGTFSTLRESDQLLRKYPIAFDLEGSIVPSLGIQSLRMLNQADLLYLNGRSFQLESHRFFADGMGFGRLDYYPKEYYKVYSFSELYDGNLTELLKEKIVILGLSEVGLGDIRITPAGEIPGALVHYTFISNILNDELLREVPLIDLLSMLLFLLLPLSWLFVRTLYRRIVLYTLSYLLFFALSKWLYAFFQLYIDTFYPLLALMLSAIVSESMLYRRQERQIGFIKDAFSSYLSPELLARLIREPEYLKLGGENKELTILFSDIRSFSTISEHLDAEHLTHLLKLYFTPMSRVVTRYNGMIDKYIGDALMAFYNAPVDVEEHAADACRSALEMLEVLKEVNHELALEGLPLLEIGIGINTAEVAVGNMGSTERFNYTVIGDGVNLASRVESLNKVYGSKIIITEFTADRLENAFLLRPLEPVAVKGKNEVVMLYELLPTTAENIALVETFKKAQSALAEAKRETALTILQELSAHDRVSRYFVKRLKGE